MSQWTTYVVLCPSWMHLLTCDTMGETKEGLALPSIYLRYPAPRVVALDSYSTWGYKRLPNNVYGLLPRAMDCFQDLISSSVQPVPKRFQISKGHKSPPNYVIQRNQYCRFIRLVDGSA
jgi:hypothetical protein